MNVESSTLARQLVALPGFVEHEALGWRVIHNGVECGAHGFRGFRASVVAWRRNGAVLDLSDDATAGCLLAWLWRVDPSMHVHRDGDAYIVHVAPGVAEHTGPTLGDALARALIAALTQVGA